MNLSDYPVHYNPGQHQFDLDIDGLRSVVEFVKSGDHTLTLTHTEVHPDLEGKGVGSYLVKSVFAYVEQNGLKIIPLCPFVSSYLQRHPEWYRIVSDDYNPNDDF